MAGERVAEGVESTSLTPARPDTCPGLPARLRAGGLKGRQPEAVEDHFEARVGSRTGVVSELRPPRSSAARQAGRKACCRHLGGQLAIMCRTQAVGGRSTACARPAMKYRTCASGRRGQPGPAVTGHVISGLAEVGGTPQAATSSSREAGQGSRQAHTPSSAPGRAQALVQLVSTSPADGYWPGAARQGRCHAQQTRRGGRALRLGLNRLSGPDAGARSGITCSAKGRWGSPMPGDIHAHHRQGDRDKQPGRPA